MQISDIHSLGRLIRERRLAAGLDAQDVARLAGVTTSTVTRIEKAEIARPSADTLRAIGGVLGIPSSDLFIAAEWIPKEELPTFAPYLRSKYRHLPAQARREIEASVERITKKYGYDEHGPRPGEDEQP